MNGTAPSRLEMNLHLGRPKSGSRTGLALPEDGLAARDGTWLRFRRRIAESATIPLATFNTQGGHRRCVVAAAACARPHRAAEDARRAATRVCGMVHAP